MSKFQIFIIETTFFSAVNFLFKKYIGNNFSAAIFLNFWSSKPGSGLDPKRVR
jgi:hypothetical protein